MWQLCTFCRDKTAYVLLQARPNSLSDIPNLCNCFLYVIVTEFGIKNNGTSLTYFEQKRKNNNDFVLRNPN